MRDDLAMTALHQRLQRSLEQRCATRASARDHQRVSGRFPPLEGARLETVYQRRLAALAFLAGALLAGALAAAPADPELASYLKDTLTLAR
jgi:hypothetical protein